MRKVAVLTFCDSFNYGAALQAYATFVFLTDMGFECKFIDYRNKNEKKLYDCFSFISSSSIVNNIKRTIKNSILCGHKNGSAGFSLFYSKLPKTKSYNERNIVKFDEKENFDYVVIGSDQVWNPDICAGKIDLIFFGNFTKKKKISFASSCGSYEYSDEEWNLIKPLLSEFSSISVREEFARTQLINKGLQKKISILLDPTLLICEKQWNRLINEKVADNIIPKEDYIVVYFVAKKYDSCEEYIKYLAEKYESKVIFINIYNIRKKYVDYYFRKITPFDFINLIAHAKGIITDSFHAIVYSII